ncbi:MAG TPA: family 16 glycoside hydrolase [Verrucomicrobiales bacterium]|nr:family 16 glycoside hydrolase [Verrucomicrobiales bacterium]
MKEPLFFVFATVLLVGNTGSPAQEPKASDSKHVLFLAGANSHGWGSHKHIAGSILLSEALPKGAPGVTTEMIREWPNAEQLAQADALVIYADGWRSHPANGHLEELKDFMDGGKGVVVLHWATGIEAAGSAAKEQGNDPHRIAWRNLVGADFEAYYSISNFYTSDFQKPANHPVMNGVPPFTLYDECYYHLRECGVEEGKIERLLPLHPPASTIEEGLTPYRGNDFARESIEKEEEQFCAWAFERPDGGRAFGFTGGHFHWSWARDEARKMVMNGFVWTAGGEVPEEGIDTPRPAAAQMLENMGVPNPGWTEEALQKALDLAQAGTPVAWGKYARGALDIEEAAGWRSLFDGETLEGWDIRAGEEKWWRVVDGAIEGGSMKERVPHNTFIAWPEPFQNFELKLSLRLISGEGDGFKNSGVQIRSRRVPDHHEMSGYQVDAGIGWWGKLYDESRRNKVIAEPADAAAVTDAAHDWDEWNHYRILCEGPRIRGWVNGVAAIDYTEPEPEIPLDGLIGLQAHGGGKFVVQFKDITIRELPPTEGAPTWENADPKD